MNAQRELAGFFLSSPLAITAFWSPLVFVFPPDSWLAALIFFVPFGWGFAAFFGLPLHIIAIRRGWVRPGYYAVGGAVGGLLSLAVLPLAGAVVGMSLTALVPDNVIASELAAWLVISTWFAGVGALTGVLFWRIGRVFDRADSPEHGTAHT